MDERTSATAAVLSWNQARALTDEVKGDMRALWLKMVRLYEGRAHEALGFKSWGAYCAVEFNVGSSRAYQLLDAGRVAQMLAGSTDVAPMTEAVAREYAPLLRDEPEAISEVAAEVVGRFGPSPTAEQVREVVDERAFVEAPEPPGLDTRFEVVEDAVTALKFLPAPDKIAWPVEDGDVEAMEEAFVFLRRWIAAAWRSWRSHRARLRAAAKNERRLRAVA